MDAFSSNTNTHLNSNIYWSMLKGLSKDIKLEQISKLSASLITSKDTVEENADKWALTFAGRWKDNRSADEIIEDIRTSRTFNRNIDL